MMETTYKTTEKTKRRVLGYVRVSTQQQVTDGQSLDDQTARIQEWARLNGYELLGIETDVGSGRTGKGEREREGLQSLIRTANREKAGIVVTDWDRLSRSEDGVVRILKQLPNRRLFATEDEQDDHYHSYGQKRSVIRAKVRAAEGEAIRTASATREALRKKKARGDRLGAPGAKSRSMRAANKARIIKADILAERIADILQADPAHDSLSHDGLAKLLNARGLKTSRGGTFTRDTVRKPRKRAEDHIREQQELASEIDPGPFAEVTIQTDDFAPSLPIAMPAISKTSAPVTVPSETTPEPEPDDADESYKNVPLYGAF